MFDMAEDEPMPAKMKPEKPSPKENALKRMLGQLGEKRVQDLQTKWATLTTRDVCNSTDWKAADKILMSLLTLGYSQVEIRSLFAVGGSRLFRLSKILKNPELEHKERAKPIHAVNEHDIERMKEDASYWELTQHIQCAHRPVKQYFTGVGHTWKAKWTLYKERMVAGNHRVISYPSWTEHIHQLYPNVCVAKPTVNLCEVCAAV